MAVITGASAGVGQQTAIALAREGLRVVLGVRPGKTDAARAAVLRACAAAEVEAYALDLEELASAAAFARAVAAAHGAVHVLVNSAGVGGLNRAPRAARDGSGRDALFAVNALGHVLLTRLLLPALLAGRGRVVCVSSVMHRWGHTRWREAARFAPGVSQYCVSKLALCALATHLNATLAPRLGAACANPGAVNSEIWYRGQLGAAAEGYVLRPLFGALMLTPEQGCATSVAAALWPLGSLVAARGGARLCLCPYVAPYVVPAAAPLPFELHGPFAGARPCAPAAAALDVRAAAELWALCAEEAAEHLGGAADPTAPPVDAQQQPPPQ